MCPAPELCSPALPDLGSQELEREGPVPLCSSMPGILGQKDIHPSIHPPIHPTNVPGAAPGFWDVDRTWCPLSRSSPREAIPSSPLPDLILSKDSGLHFKSLSAGRAVAFPVLGRLRKLLVSQEMCWGRRSLTLSILGEGRPQAYFPYLETWGNGAEPPYGNAE